MQAINRDQLKQIMDSRQPFTLIEVLSSDQYEEFHLPEAINVPIGVDGFEARIQEAVPDKATPVVVYCHDEACNASPTAARKMDELGYQKVFDCKAGKMDWREAGRPVVT